jgi:hypothetical protein
MSEPFSRILGVDVPESVPSDPDTGKNRPARLAFTADGPVPFPQILLRAGGREHLFRGGELEERPGEGGARTYAVELPAGRIGPGEYEVRLEGCRRQDWENAGGGDWIGESRRLRVERPPARVEAAGGEEPATPARRADPSGAKLYFGIHKHMHQPFYRAADPMYWDGEKEQIFGSRAGNYTRFLPDMVQQYADGGLPHAGVTTSWSGSLVEQLERSRAEGRCGGAFDNWNARLKEAAALRTERGHPRLDVTAFGYFHPLMPLIPHRNIVRQIAWHRELVKEALGAEASPVLFPPETAFHVRMIPALREAGVEAVIYDSIHRFRACRDYPYAGPEEGMLPPNPAEQANPPVDDWLQLHNIWAGSEISPRLLRPEVIRYEDPEGQPHTIVGVPAERYIGNEDARGGFGALQYPDVLGQVLDRIVETGSYDPAHPPFFLLHSDGDNHGGGAESYYYHNAGQLVEWVREDPRFELTTVQDYLDRFPPDADDTVHIEPGSWSGADNGDPQFMKWFSRYREDYSPDLNSWAVLTALQNAAHTLEDAGAAPDALRHVERLMLTAETSCYWYWTGQEVWDRQVTEAANAAFDLVQGELDRLLQEGRDPTPPTIFPPWVLPENPGGKTWGGGGLVDAPREGRVHTFIHDVSGLKRVTLHLRREGGAEETQPMADGGPYPSRTDPRAVARLFTAEFPPGAGDLRYWIEAEDTKGNVARSALERIFCA